jgi:kynurenine formamidase
MFDQFDIIDLTHPLNPSVPTWNGSCGFCLEVKMDYDRMFRVHQIKMHAGVGTHMDSPSHKIPGAAAIADMSVENFLAPACVIDVSKKANADYEITPEDVKDYEKSYGLIGKGSLVIGYTGWSRFWSDKDRYRNVDKQGFMHFPAFSIQAAELLFERGIVGIAIDTLSPDCQDRTYPVHHLFLSSGKYIIENIANGEQMAPKGGYVIALPLRAEEATESPIRIIGLIPKNSVEPSSVTS